MTYAAHEIVHRLISVPMVFPIGTHSDRSAYSRCALVTAIERHKSQISPLGLLSRYINPTRCFQLFQEHDVAIGLATGWLLPTSPRPDLAYLHGVTHSFPTQPDTNLTIGASP